MDLDILGFMLGVILSMTGAAMVMIALVLHFTKK